MFIQRALMAGEPRWNTPDTGSGDTAAPGDDGASESPSGGNDLFDKGYGKGVNKGKQEGVNTVLSELGVQSLDQAKAAIKAAQEAQEAARKAAEQQGEYKSLYEEAQSKLAQLSERAKLADRYEESQQAELAAMTEKMADEDKAILDGLPLDRALALAKRLTTAAAKPPVGNGPASNGTDPGKTGGKDLAWYERKGYANLSKEERSEADRLMSERDSMTIEELKRRHQMGAA